ncbi:hypothetical protein QBC47DRAFT_32015 [Echria macrotheca]|uniref:N-acetyltransferase domain-containing protein n=1 Tax=Echria macrotheca TaxID=438768 RepID=A0AAJ0F812_9PEZI|nr:hypothetical protein QBC47DRAFT_32015 [Echria macrotheca]
MTTNFRIRDATTSEDDLNFLVAAFDSTLPHLATIGSGAQWGSIPFSQREGTYEQELKDLRAAEAYRLTREGPEFRILIAEAKDGNDKYIPVGWTTLRGEYLSPYLLEASALDHVTKTAKNYLFMYVLVTDFRAGALRKGVGAALVQYAKAWAEELGKDVFYVDCWGGNDGKLIKFYEAQGFSRAGEFFKPRKDGTIWHGVFLSMNLKKGKQ